MSCKLSGTPTPVASSPSDLLEAAVASGGDWIVAHNVRDLASGAVRNPGLDAGRSLTPAGVVP